MTQRQAKITINTREAGTRLDAWVASRFTYHALDEWVSLIQTKRLLVNGQSSRADYCLCAGDVVAYHPDSYAEPEVSKNIQVLYEDDALLAINKPPDLPCHPGGRYFKHTLLYWLRGKYPEARLINRLDRETSGVILVAKNKKIAGKLGRQFERRQVTKEYQALVEGQFPDQLTADGVLIMDENSPVIKKRLFLWEGQGETSSTQFRRLACGGGLSLVHVTLGTGRMHQIRATLSALGYPVVGDKIYGLDETIFLRFINQALTPEDHTRLRLPRQALHAWKLTIRHPITRDTMSFEAPWPRDVKRLLKISGM
jgi:23S rRNA pseudouridine955/2504/2580 synthase/23S rRNA pseudouridine1911/1915/1917 synthase